MIRKFLLLVVSCAAVTACNHSVGLNTQYLQSERAIEGTLDGSGAVAMSAFDRNRVVSSNPTSYTGSATTLTAPVGLIVGEAAIAAFDSAGLSSVVSISEDDSTATYDYIIEPRIASFSYKYDQLSNLGMAVTPKVDLVLHIRIRDSAGEILLDSSYSRIDYHRGAYIASFEPHEKVNMALHEAAYDIMIEAANDLVASTSTNSATPASGTTGSSEDEDLTS